jgi:hypothetical protein
LASFVWLTRAFGPTFGAVVFFLADWFRSLNGHEAMDVSSLMSFVEHFSTG